jgi:hypothetical protein
MICPKVPGLNARWIGGERTETLQKEHFGNLQTRRERECRSSRIQSRSKPLDLGGHTTKIYALCGNVFRRKPKIEETKLPKPKMEKKIMTVHWRWTHDKDPHSWERGDRGVID